MRIKQTRKANGSGPNVCFYYISDGQNVLTQAI